MSHLSWFLSFLPPTNFLSWELWRKKWHNEKATNDSLAAFLIAWLLSGSFGLLTPPVMQITKIYKYCTFFHSPNQYCDRIHKYKYGLKKKDYINWFLVKGKGEIKKKSSHPHSWMPGNSSNLIWLTIRNISKNCSISTWGGTGWVRLGDTRRGNQGDHDL